MGKNIFNLDQIEKFKRSVFSKNYHFLGDGFADPRQSGRQAKRGRKALILLDILVLIDTRLKKPV